LDQPNPANNTRDLNGSSDPQMRSYKAAADAAYSYSKQKLLNKETDSLEQNGR
jgi:hypothetical protein